MKLEDLILQEDDPSIVGHLQLEIYVKKDKGENKILKLPLSQESNKLSHEELEEISYDYYIRKHNTDETYGIAFKIIEK